MREGLASVIKPPPPAQAGVDCASAHRSKANTTVRSTQLSNLFRKIVTQFQLFPSALSVCLCFLVSCFLLSLSFLRPLFHLLFLLSGFISLPFFYTFRLLVVLRKIEIMNLQELLSGY
jgi:hypothetical protein